MTEVHTVHQGTTPLLISVPHDGRLLPQAVEQSMTDVGRDLPDTDWHVRRLYEFARDLGASLVVANYSRYVVDLNRPSDDVALYAGQVATGLCPLHSFAGDALYADDFELLPAARSERVDTFWQPYHQHIESQLAALRDQYGYALLWDAHSIPSIVPRLFDGELPVLNLGTNAGASCSQTIADAVFDVATASSYEAVSNARFKGGYITRHYGTPAEGIHAIQLEIAQRAYMNEASRAYDQEKALQLQAGLRAMLQAFTAAAAIQYQ